MKVCEIELLTVGPAAFRILWSEKQHKRQPRGDQRAKGASKRDVRKAKTYDMDAVGARSPICRSTASYANSW